MSCPSLSFPACFFLRMRHVVLTLQKQHWCHPTIDPLLHSWGACCYLSLSFSSCCCCVWYCRYSVLPTLYYFAFNDVCRPATAMQFLCDERKRLALLVKITSSTSGIAPTVMSFAFLGPVTVIVLKQGSFFRWSKQTAMIMSSDQRLRSHSSIASHS